MKKGTCEAAVDEDGPMLLLIAIVVVLAASASLWGSYDTRRDMGTGRPQYESLADFTGTWDRHELSQLYGPPDHEDRYTVPVETIKRLPQGLWVRCFDSIFMDLASIAGAVAGSRLHFIEHSASVWLIVITAAYQVIAWTIALWTVAQPTKSESSEK